MLLNKTSNFGPWMDFVPTEQKKCFRWLAKINKRTKKSWVVCLDLKGYFDFIDFPSWHLTMLQTGITLQESCLLVLCFRYCVLLTCAYPNKSNCSSYEWQLQLRHLFIHLNTCIYSLNWGASKWSLITEFSVDQSLIMALVIYWS